MSAAILPEDVKNELSGENFDNDEEYLAVGSDCDDDISDTDLPADEHADEHADNSIAHPDFLALSALVGAFERAVRNPTPLTKSVKAKTPRATAAPRTYVVNRLGERVLVKYDLITERNEDLRSNPEYGPELEAIDSTEVTAAVALLFRNGMTTRALDYDTAWVCSQRAVRHPDYEALSARIHVSDLHKRTPEALPAMVDALIAAAPYRDAVRISPELERIIARAAPEIAKKLAPNRDYRFRIFGYTTLSRSYLQRPGPRDDEESTLKSDQLLERPQHRYMCVALGVFVSTPDGRGDEAPEPVFAARLADAFQLYDALSLQLVSNATPTMLNAGSKVPQLSSCFQVPTGDDLKQLGRTIVQLMLISKWSGGTSLWLHGVRAERALIRGTNGRGKGIKRYIKMLEQVQLYADQGGNRAGAFAIYLSVDHDDIFTFLKMPRHKVESNTLNAPDLKYALWVPDMFMEALLEQIERPNDSEAGIWYLFSPDEAPGLHLVWGEEYRALRAKYVAEKRYRRKVRVGDILDEAFTTWSQVGNPYVMFKDACNRLSNMKNVAPIMSSNLCVSGDTFILTGRGQWRIAALENQTVDVWNGEEWSTTTVRRTGEGELLRVTLDDGSFLDCTPYHKWHIYDRSDSDEKKHEKVIVVDSNEPIEVEAKALKPGMYVEQSKPITVSRCDSAVLDGAYAAGEGMAIRVNQNDDITDDCVMMTHDLWSRFNWIAGFIDSDGVNAMPKHVDIMRQVRLICLSLGFVTRVTTSKTEACHLTFRSAEDRDDLATAIALATGADFAEYQIRKAKWTKFVKIDPTINVKVVSVEPRAGAHATFCFNEPKRHRGMFNGILTGNCTEILIPSWSDYDAKDFARFHPGNGKSEIGVCNLAAVCLESYVVSDEKHSSVAAAYNFGGVVDAAALETRALNRVVDLNFYPTSACRRSNQRHRPIGIGIMGLDDALSRLRLGYGSRKACQFARGIAAALYYGALCESARLAEIDGPYSTFAGSPISEGKLQPDLWVEAGKLEPDWEDQVAEATSGLITPAMWAALRARAKKGVRNAYVTAYMPTATTSNIVGQNESFERRTSNLYTRETQAGEFYVIDRHLVAELTEHGIWDAAMSAALLAANGSVANIGRIPADIRRRYRTARELDPSCTTRMVKAMAPFVDQSMSVNLFMSEPSLPRVLRFLVDNWEAGLKNGMYYYHTAPRTGALKTGSESATGTLESATGTEPAAPVTTVSVKPAMCRRDDPSCLACVL